MRLFLRFVVCMYNKNDLTACRRTFKKEDIE
jgi:hypothetical protein